LISPLTHTIVISPIGDLEHLPMNPIQIGVQQIFHCRTEVISLITDLDFALDPGRNQYHSSLILEKLADLAPDHAIKVLAICHVDLFIPILTHVYGEAQLGGRACIISTSRLKQDLPPINPQASLEKRMFKEAMHELGHTFDLRHCKDNVCTMHYCRTIEDVDKKSDQFCRYCRVLLEDEKKRLGIVPEN
jgi:archaemetzincin